MGRRASRGMNLFEFIALIGICAGIAIGLWTGVAEGGWGAGFWGALKGGFYAFLVYAVFMFLLLSTFSLALLWRPFFPTCKNGRCKDPDYDRLYLEDKAPPEHEALQAQYLGRLARCRCGTLYLDSERDRCLYEVAENGTVTPYMRYRPLGRWRRA